MSMSDDSDWEPFRIGDDLYDPRTGRYRYRERGKFARATFPDYLPDYIGEYEREMAGGGGAPSGPNWSNWEPVESLRCKAARYDYDERNLLMAWYNGKLAWVYRGVEEEVFSDFLSTESKGKYVNSVLNNYPHSRIGPSEMRYFEGHDEYVGV